MFFVGKKTEKLDDATCTCPVLQPVGCDGELYSSKTVDRCGVCGGNGTSCQRISGSYRKALTQLGNTHTHTCIMNVV